MKTLLRFAAYLIFYVCGYLLVCKLNYGFYNYTRIYFNFRVPELLSPIFFVPVCLMVFAVMVSLIWNTAEPRGNFILERLNKIDYLLLVTLTACAVYYSVNILYKNRTFFTFFITPIMTYAAVILLVYTTVIRVREKNLKRTIYWIEFYKVYPLNNYIGFLMALLTTGNVIILLTYLKRLVYLSDYRYAISSDINTFIFSAFTLTALTYFCVYLLSLSEQYERVHEEKIREKIKSERFKTELITNVSHDIRTPLTSIINYIDLIKRLNINNIDLSEYISVLDKKSLRLKMLITDLIEASKAGAGNIPVNSEEINLIEMAGQIAGEFDGAFADNRLNFIFILPDFKDYAQTQDQAQNKTHANDKITVLADGRHLWRVMENIFGNAIKYSLPETRVYAEIKKDGGATRFSLKNISKAPLGLNVSSSELTEQFVRGDRSRTSEGSGLGLYIAKSLAELMGARFDIMINGDLFEVVLTFYA